MKYFAQLLVSLSILFILVTGAIQWASAFQFYRGKKFYQNQKWPQALEAFQSSQALFSRNPETHRWLAKTYLQLLPERNLNTQINLLKKAETELLRAIAIEPKYPYYWALLGRVSEQMEHIKVSPHKSALDCYRQAMMLDPNNPLFLELLAKFLLQNQMPDQAKPLIAKIVRIAQEFAYEPTQLWLEKKYPPEDLVPLFASDIQALSWLQKTLNSFGHHQTAVIVGEKALQLAPENPDAILIYASAIAITQPCSKVEQTLAPLFTQSEYEEKARKIYLSCLNRTGETELAEKEYLALIALRPQSLEYRYLLAHLYLKKRQPNLAKAHLLWLFNQPTLKDQNMKANIILNLAQIFEQEQNYPQAFRFYQLYLNLRPEDQNVKAKLNKLKAYQPSDIIYSPWEKPKEEEEEETEKNIIYPPKEFGEEK